MINGTVRGQLGALQIHRTGYLANVMSTPLSMDFAWDDALAQKVRAVPGVTAIAPRIQFAGSLTLSAVDENDSPEALFFAATAIDPADSAERLAALGRIEAPRFFARLEVGGQPAAIGASAVEGDWAGIFGMRTAPSHRRQGYAARILATLLAKARQAGATKAYLQVEAANVGAIPIYQRAGFEVAYRYYYWARLAAH